MYMYTYLYNKTPVKNTMSNHAIGISCKMIQGQDYL